jgi:MYXO-CTERM domain-containing protein
MRVRALGVPGTGMVEVRANGATLLTDTPLPPGGSVDFVSPSTAGWVRASLYTPDGAAQRKQLCDPVVGAQTTLCRYEVGLLAMTSAIYLDVPAVVATPTPCPTRGHSTVCHPGPHDTPTPAAGMAGAGLLLAGRRLRRRRR